MVWHSSRAPTALDSLTNTCSPSSTPEKKRQGWAEVVACKCAHIHSCSVLGRRPGLPWLLYIVECRDRVNNSPHSPNPALFPPCLCGSGRALAGCQHCTRTCRTWKSRRNRGGWDRIPGRFPSPLLHLFKLSCTRHWFILCYSFFSLSLSLSSSFTPSHQPLLLCHSVPLSFSCVHLGIAVSRVSAQLPQRPQPSNPPAADLRDIWRCH